MWAAPQPAITQETGGEDPIRYPNVAKPILREERPDTQSHLSYHVNPYVTSIQDCPSSASDNSIDEESFATIVMIVNHQEPVYRQAYRFLMSGRHMIMSGTI